MNIIDVIFFTHRLPISFSIITCNYLYRCHKIFSSLLPSEEKVIVFFSVMASWCHIFIVQSLPICGGKCVFPRLSQWYVKSSFITDVSMYPSISNYGVPISSFRILYMFIYVPADGEYLPLSTWITSSLFPIEDSSFVIYPVLVVVQSVALNNFKIHLVMMLSTYVYMISEDVLPPS